MANFSSWTSLFTFVGFVLILAGTSMDSYLRNGARHTGDGVTFNMGQILSAESQDVGDTTVSGPTFYAADFYENAQQNWGTLGNTFGLTHGFSYKYICPTKGNGHYYDHRNHSSPNHGYTSPGSPHAADEGRRALMINRVSAGMIAMLLLSVTIGFVASLLSILASTNSTITNDLNGAKQWAVGAFLMVLVTWALWLRAQYEYLRPNNHIEADCRFHSVDSMRENLELADGGYLSVYVGASFGLAIVSCLAYLMLFVHIGRVTAANQGASARAGTTIQWAAIGFVAIFVAATLNSWSHAGFTKYDETCGKVFSNAAQEIHYIWNEAEQRGDSRNGWDNLSYRSASNGNAHCTYSNSFGVFTAFESISVSMPYADIQNRAFLCSVNKLGHVDVEKDDAGQGLVQGGRVTLGFAITATIISFISGVVGVSRAVHTFWLNCISLGCVVVALLVWGITADYVIQGRCCPGCHMGPSVGLLASGAIFLLFAIFYQAWVVADEVYVLPAHAYGMASKAEADAGATI